MKLVRRMRTGDNKIRALTFFHKLKEPGPSFLMVARTVAYLNHPQSHRFILKHKLSGSVVQAI